MRSWLPPVPLVSRGPISTALEGKEGGEGEGGRGIGYSGGEREEGEGLIG